MRNRYYPLLALTLTLALTLFFLSLPLEARLLNLNGFAELSFSSIRFTTNDTSSTTESLLQRYSIGSFGDLVTGRIANYNASFTFNRTDSKTDGSDQGNMNLSTYNLNLNLFPRWYPVALYANRTVIETELHQLTKNTVDRYGLSWALSTKYLPSIRLNLDQTVSEIPDNPDTKTKSFGLSTSKSIGPASISASYQLVELNTGTETTRFHNYNLGLAGGLPFSFPLVKKEDITIGLRVNYTTNLSAASGGAGTPGFAISQERSAGADIFYRPNLVWNAGFNYDFSQTPLPGTDFNRHIANATLNIRPTGNIDFSGSYRFLFFNLTDTRTSSQFVTTVLNYRPIFGLSTGINTTLGLTDVSSAPGSETLSQSYGYFINYSKTMELIQFNTGYNLSYSSSNTSTSDLTSSTIVNSINLGMSNTNTRIVRVSFNYTFTDIDSSLQDNQKTNIFSLSADSSYFRDLLLMGDNLYLSGSSSLMDTQGVGETITLNSNATYYIWSGLSLKAGYTYSDTTQAGSSHQDTYFEEINWTRYLFRSVSLVIGLRDSTQRTQGAGSSDKSESREASSLITYQIGKVSLSIEYRLTNSETDVSQSNTQFFYILARRPF